MKLCAALVFVMFFIVAAYAVVTHANERNPLFLAMQELRDVDVGAVASIVAYVVTQLLISLWQASHSGNPRMTWARDTSGTGVVSFLAMFFMMFAAFFVARPILERFDRIGIAIDANVLLASLMVIVRFCLTLIAATFSEPQLKAIAQNPYAQP